MVDHIFFSFHSDSESIVGLTPDVQAGARGAVAAEQGLDWAVDGQSRAARGERHGRLGRPADIFGGGPVNFPDSPRTIWKSWILMEWKSIDFFFENLWTILFFSWFFKDSW